MYVALLVMLLGALIFCAGIIRAFLNISNATKGNAWMAHPGATVRRQISSGVVLVIGALMFGLGIFWYFADILNRILPGS